MEAVPDVDRFFRETDAHETRRFRQAVGVVVRMVMEQLGWERTGQKGHLGRRVKVAAGTTTPGASYNVEGSPSHWFNRAEHYRPDRLLAWSENDQRRYVARALRGLEAVRHIGTEQEKQETLEYLKQALGPRHFSEGTD